LGKKDGKEEGRRYIVKSKKTAGEKYGKGQKGKEN
jgi:hypothetical protein